MVPNLLIHTLRGMLRSGNRESVCNVTLRVAGQGNASYYTNPEIVDSSVIPALEDGDYTFNYLGESDVTVEVTRRDGHWLNVPPSTKAINPA